MFNNLALKNLKAESAAIKKNADAILSEMQLQKRLSLFGDLFFTGSYAMNLMTWNDIDMQLVLHDQSQPKKAFFEIVHHFFCNDSFIKAELIHFQGTYKPVMPRGLYLGLNINNTNHGGMWKLDLWILEQDDFDKNQEFMEQLQGMLTAELRDLVLQLKFELIGNQSRVPQLGSYFIYQAILKGCLDRSSILNYLREMLPL